LDLYRPQGYKSSSNPNLLSLNLETYIDSRDNLAKVFSICYKSLQYNETVMFYIIDYPNFYSNRLILLCIDSIWISNYNNNYFITFTPLIGGLTASMVEWVLIREIVLRSLMRPKQQRVLLIVLKNRILKSLWIVLRVYGNSRRDAVILLSNAVSAEPFSLSLFKVWTTKIRSTIKELIRKCS
jgi:hypothetical protein